MKWAAESRVQNPPLSANLNKFFYGGVTFHPMGDRYKTSRGQFGMDLSPQGHVWGLRKPPFSAEPPFFRGFCKGGFCTNLGEVSAGFCRFLQGFCNVSASFCSTIPYSFGQTLVNVKHLWVSGIQYLDMYLYISSSSFVDRILFFLIC